MGRLIHCARMLRVGAHIILPVVFASWQPQKSRLHCPCYTRAFLEPEEKNGEFWMRKGQLLVLTTLVVSVLTAGCGNSQRGPGRSVNSSSASSQSTPDQFVAARGLYEKDCKSCHGPNGEGGPVKLDDGTKLKVPTFREGHALRHPDSDFVKQITKGGDGMPAFGEKLKTEEINDLVKFIRHEFQGK